MELTNRALIVGVALVWMSVILVVLLFVWAAPDESIKRLADLAGYLDDHNNTATKLAITFGGLILALLGALVIVFELSPAQTSSLKVTKVGSGDARIATDEIAMRIEEEVGALPQVSQVQAVVAGKGTKADVSLDLRVRPEADLAATTEEACRITRQLVEERMGVELLRPPVAQLHYNELLVAQTRPTAPSPAPAPTPVAPSPSMMQSPSPADAAPPAAGAESSSNPGPFIDNEGQSPDRPAGG